MWRNPPGVDLRHLLWVSIENDDSLDLDPLTAAQVLTDKQVNVLVAVADVGVLFRKGSAIDAHARHTAIIIQTKENYDAVDSIGHYSGRRRGDSMGD